MIDHKERTVTDEDYYRILAQLYPDQIDENGSVNMTILAKDCVTLGADHIFATHMWTDTMQVYFLARTKGLI